MWVPIQQYTDRASQSKLFNHLHALSLRWHLSRKTGEGFFLLMCPHTHTHTHTDTYHNTDDILIDDRLSDDVQ